MDYIRKPGMEVSIKVDGQRVPIYEHNGRYWIAGEAGKSYSILVRNLTSSRIEVLESVDGRNVLKDETASLSNSGMVFRDVWENHGWRINDNETRDFVFGSPEASIAAQATGSVSNVGVIGVAIFQEMPQRRPSITFSPPTIMWGATTDVHVKSLSGNLPTADSAPIPASADLGTGMGESRADSVGHTSFVRETNMPLASIEIQYRSHEWLVAQGIIKPAAPPLPSAWPSDDTGYGKYAK